MSKNLLSILLCMVFLGLLDIIWLSFATPRFYAPMMDDLLRHDMQFAPAIAFYVMFAFALSRFAIQKNFGAPLMQTGLDGALMGLVAYGTYNLTGLAVISQWNAQLALIDTTWGVFVSAAASLLSASTLKIINKN